MVNKRQIIISFLIIVFLFSLAIFSYAEEQAASPQTLTIQQLKEDTDFFFKTIEDTHPDIYFRISKEDYEYYKDLCYEKIKKPITAEDYYKVLAEFLNKFGDGHTRVSSPVKSAGKDLAQPFLTDWVDGHLVITKVFGDFPVKAGDIILYINDISAQEWLDSKMKYTSYNDYQSARRSMAKWYFRNSFTSELKHDIIVSNGNNKVFKWKCPLFNKKDKKIFGDYYFNPGTIKLTDNLGISDKPFEFSLWKELNVGYLKWDNFFDRQCYKALKNMEGKKLDPIIMNKIPDFSEMLEKSFKQMNANNSKYFIIDIRGNGGGSSLLGDQLLKYITDRNLKCYKEPIKISNLFKEQRGGDDFFKFVLSKFPCGTLVDSDTIDKLKEEYSKTKKNTSKNVFDFIPMPKVDKLFSGKLIILIDNKVFSSAEDFAGKCSDNDVGIIIGESTGGGGSVPGDILFFELPISKVNVSVSSSISIRPDQSRINERAVYPDYYVYQTLEDFRNGKDTVLEFVKKGIRENKF